MDALVTASAFGAAGGGLVLGAIVPGIAVLAGIAVWRRKRKKTPD